MTVSPRAESLNVIRDLISLIVRKNIKSRKKLGHYADREEIFQKSTGKTLLHSRIYHYTSTLRLLGLDETKEPGKIQLDGRARKLAKLGRKYYKDNKLHLKEKKVFREILFTSEYVQENFLSFFSPKNKLIKTYNEFIKFAQPVYVIDFNKRKNVCNIMTESGITNTVDLMGWYYTMRYWFRDLELIDQFDFPGKLSHIKKGYKFIFPIKQKISNYSRLDKLEKIIKTAVSPRGPITIPVPIVIQEICKRFFIPVENAKKIIKTLYKEKPDIYYLSRAPKSLLKPPESYLEVDGALRSELFINIRVGRLR